MKKVLRSMIALCLVLIAMCGLSLSVAAADSIATAEEISFGDTNYGQLTKDDGKDMYAFELSSSGCVTLDITAYINYTSYYVYDENGNGVWQSTYQTWNKNTEEYKNSWPIYLMKGTYYLAVCSEYKCSGNYQFKTSFKTSSESFVETLDNTNNSIREADTISLGKAYNGQLAFNDGKDLYKFTMPSSGCVTLDITAFLYRTSYYLYDENGNVVWSSTYQYTNENTDEYKNSWQFYLMKGTYYLAVCREYSDSGNYQFKTSFKTSSESFAETLDNTNNSIREADTISLGKAYKGQLALNDDKDLYKFTMPSSGCVTLDMTAYIYRTSYYLYDENGNDVWRSTYRYWNDTSKTYAAENEWTLEKGTYYLAVCREYSDAGNYSFSIKCSHQWKTKTITKATLTKNGKVTYVCSVCKATKSNNISRATSFKLSTTSYTYNGKAKTPTVTVKDSAGKTLKKNTDYTVSYASGRKNVGTYKVTIKMKGNYTGTKTLTFKINPVNISKCTVKLSATSYTYNGAVKTPSVTVKNANGTKLTKNTHYTVSYASGRKNVGTYKVTIKGKGNYTGTKTLTFKINPINISKCTVKLSATSYTYSGTVITPSVTVKNANGTKLTKNTHYTVTYASGRKNVGTYKVTIKMKGKYTGTKTLTFKIVPKAASINKLTAKTKALTVKLNRIQKQSTGYQIQYATNKNFTGAKTKVLSDYETSTTTLTGLKAKTTYFVRVRTYKKVGNTTYYSNWSSYKYLKTK